jgi:regulator of protease activity HflC (stomatin/prohibitin superfamily)
MTAGNPVVPLLKEKRKKMNIASLIQSFGGLAWAVFFFLLVVVITRAARKQPTRGLTTMTIGVLLLAIVFSTVGAGLVFVQPEQRGVVLSAFAPNGYRETVLQPGLRWVIPFAEQVRLYSISRQTYTMSATPSEGQRPGDDSIRARTRDGQEVYIDSSVIYSIDPERVIDLHIRWQNRYDEELVRPLARGIIRDAASQYSIEEIVSSKRDEFKQVITEELSKRLADNDLQLVDFVLRDIHFSEEYAKAVEQKQIAEQQALQAQFVVEQKKQEAEQARQTAQGEADAAVIRAEGEAKARVIQAQAEAEALQIIAQILADNPQLLTYEYIQKLSPNVQVMFLPNDAPFIFPLPENNATNNVPVPGQ